jgi:hypothetical protein
MRPTKLAMKLRLLVAAGNRSEGMHWCRDSTGFLNDGAGFQGAYLVVLGLSDSLSGVSTARNLPRTGSMARYLMAFPLLC